MAYSQLIMITAIIPKLKGLLK